MFCCRKLSKHNRAISFISFKGYLAAFDSREYKRILFVAHREEILNQAAATFYSVRPDSSVGFFSDGRRDMNCDITFATVQTIGKKEYLCDECFSKDAFDYIYNRKFVFQNKFKN